MSLEHSPARQRKASGMSVYQPSYTPDEFCTAERISRSALYKLWNAGKGPRFYWNGVCRIIPHNARLEWQQDRMNEAEALERAKAQQEQSEVA
jgi:hypothetical protein